MCWEYDIKVPSIVRLNGPKPEIFPDFTVAIVATIVEQSTKVCIRLDLRIGKKPSILEGLHIIFRG